MLSDCRRTGNLTYRNAASGQLPFQVRNQHISIMENGGSQCRIRISPFRREDIHDVTGISGTSGRYHRYAENIR